MAGTRVSKVIMQRTFRYPLQPNQSQAAVFETWLIACQQLYNAALEERRDAWRKTKCGLSLYDQQKELTLLRIEDPLWAAVPTLVARSALRRLDLAFKAFFRRARAGQKPGYPRFRNSDRYDSFGIGRAKIVGDRVFIPKLGSVRFINIASYVAKSAM